MVTRPLNAEHAERTSGTASPMVIIWCTTSNSGWAALSGITPTIRSPGQRRRLPSEG